MKKYVFFIFLFCLVIGLYCLSGYFLQCVSAVTQGDYNRPAPGGGISVEDWNFLDEDFLLTDGVNSVLNDLDMNNNRIINLDSGNGQKNAASKEYVDNGISAVQGGDTYINWGRAGCAGSDILLYDGYGFGNEYSNSSGGDNPICIQEPFDGEMLSSGAKADGVFPLMTGTSAILPTNMIDPSSTIDRQRFIKCAVCYRPNSACFINQGTHNCGVPGFGNKIYDGYLTGEVNYPTHYASTERYCLNRNFDASILAPDWGAIWYGARVEENFGLSSYETKKFIKCSVCCN
ncbi:hypothetical protein KAU09_02210 [Candidatus Parcubacteria bacterium]|nr:hypothetical protein [Candidatus Parcubacteria bacterium]